MPINAAIAVPGSTVLAPRGGGGADGPVVVPKALAYFDDFESYPVWPDPASILVGGAPNWDGVTGNASTSGSRYNVVVKTGKQVGLRPTGALDVFSKDFLVSPPVDVGSANHALSWHIAGLNGNGPNISFLGTDGTNRLEISLLENAVRRYKTAGDSYLFSFAPNANVRLGIAKSHEVGDRWDVRAYGGVGRFYRNYRRYGTSAGYDVSDFSGSRVGISPYAGWFQEIDDIGYDETDCDFTITSTTDRSYSRVQGLGGYAKGARDITWSGTYTGNLEHLVFALVEAGAGGKFITNPLPPEAETIGGGTFSVTCRVPCGPATYADGSPRNPLLPYVVVLFAAKEIGGQLVYNPILFDSSGLTEVAYTVLGVGQSLMGIYFSHPISGGTVPDHPGGTVYIPQWPQDPAVKADTLPVTQWETSLTETETGDSHLGHITKVRLDQIGMPMRFVMVAIGARSAIALNPLAATAEGAWIRAHIALAGGLFDEIFFDQGQDEVNSTGTSAALNWFHQWVDINFPGYLSLNNQPGNPVIPINFVMTGKYLDAITPENANIIRRAQEDMAALPNFNMVGHTVGAPLDVGDKVHPSEAGADLICIGVGREMVYRDGGTLRGIGPTVSAGTVSGNTATFPLVPRGAISYTSTDNSGTGITGIELWGTSDFSSGQKTLSEVHISGTNLVVTCSGAISLPCYLRAFAGPAYDDSNVVIGVQADGTRSPMAPIAHGVAAT